MFKQNIFCLMVLYLTIVIKIYCSETSLDTTFNPTGINTNTSGTVTTAPTTFNTSGNHSQALALAIQPDNKIVAGGFSNAGFVTTQFSIARYNTDGSLDTTFNGTGTVVNSFATSANGIAIQSDNKIIGVGTRANVGGGFALARYNTDGSLDTTFNGTGMVTTDFSTFFGVGTSSGTVAVVIQPTDQSIIVSGFVQGSGISGHTQFLIARYTTAGTLDTTFNGTGFINIPASTFGSFINATSSAVSLQSNGKIIIAGNASSPSSFALARLNTDGTLDTTFNPGIGAGFNGVEVTNASAFAANPDAVSAFAMTIQSDDKIIVAGSFTDSVLFNENFAVARYNANGGLDTTFNGTGTQVTQAGITTSQANGVGIQITGEIVVGGFADDVDGNTDVALVRYTSTGILDTTFGPNGIITTPPVSFNANSEAIANALAIQSDDKIVIAGFADANTTPSTFDSFALARYAPTISPTPATCITNLNQAIIDKYGISPN